MSSRKPYFSSCVSWPEDRLEDLMTLVDDPDEMSFEEFQELVDPSALQALENHLGYGPGSRPASLADDVHVRFITHASGVVACVHSAIEHVFATPQDLDALALATQDRLADDMTPGM